MPDEVSPQAPHAMSRRGLLTAAAAVAGAAVASPLLAACDSPGGAKGPAATGKDDLAKILPDFIPNTSVKADIASVTGANGAASNATFLSYPTSPIETVKGVPGKGGTYTTRTPLWGAIPPSSGNAYYDTVNKNLGATLKMQPADGNTYVDTLPPLFASDNLPDWIQIPGWAATKVDLGNAVAKFADLTPYLAGNKIAKYPNLANIAPGAWSAGAWNGKLYGIPVYPTAAAFAGYLFYRKDLLAAAGVSPDIKNADDLFNLGKALTNAAAGKWAFDDLWTYLLGPFKVIGKWMDVGGKLVHWYETEQIKDQLNFHAKIVKAGYMHPDAVAGQNKDAKQRFWSGKVAITGDGTGAWNGDDAKNGTAADKNYSRQAFKPFDAKGGKPEIELGALAGWFSFLNKKLSDAQIQEILSIANYLAAPYGSKEYLAVNFGAEGVTYTMKDNNPVLTDKGNKEVATTYQFLVTPPETNTPTNGAVQVTKDVAAWQAEAVKAAVKPMFWSMNVTEPAQFSSIGQQVEDTITDVRLGRKPISAYDEAVAAWRKAGGEELRKFREEIRTKFGTGQ